MANIHIDLSDPERALARHDEDQARENIGRRDFLMQMKNVALVAGVGAPLMLTQSGCATPTADLQRALLQKLTTSLMQVGLSFNLHNPNSYPIPLRAVGWKIDLFSSPFTSGSVNFGRQIPAARTIEALVPLSVNISNLLRQAQGLLTQKSIPWGIAGKCVFALGNQQLGAPFNLRGTWPNPIAGARLPNIPGVTSPRTNSGSGGTTRPRRRRRR